MSAAMEAAMKHTFHSPMVEGFPPNTDLQWHGLDTARDAYTFYMVTRRHDSHAITVGEFTSHDLKSELTSQAAFQEQVSTKLQEVRQRHWFLLAYERGGYC